MCGDIQKVINGDGKIEAEGNHKGLLKPCKGYKELYESEIKDRK